MPNINIAILAGHVGSDPEYRTLGNGINMVTFSLATNTNHKDANGEWQTETSWHNIIGWGYIADKLKNKNVTKGSAVFVEGKIQYKTWTDKSGASHRQTTIVAHTVDVLEKKNRGSYSTNNNTSNNQSSNTQNIHNDNGNDVVPF